MKYSYLFLLFAMILASCGDNAPTTDSTDEKNTTTTVSTANTNAQPVAQKKDIEGTPTTIKGIITGMQEGAKIFFDKKTIDATDIIDKTILANDGSFELNTGVASPGIYRLRLGAKPVYMLLKGGESVELSATMDGYKIKDYQLSGSLHSEEMKRWTADMDKKKIVDYLTNASESKPLLHLYLVEKLDLVSNIELYVQVLEELQAAYPEELYTKQFSSKVRSMEAKINAQPVRIGREAPEIDLPNPDGEKTALSSLKGKVVLLDFWASWCRPCRMANPHVVEMYDKYSKKGFDVYNVSLDGIDDRRAAMYKHDKDAIAKATEMERKKWRDAIKADKLRWKNHVSELRSWSSPVAVSYGVNAIPKTYLLDKKGVVRYENLRGPALEEAIKTLLEE